MKFLNLWAYSLILSAIVGFSYNVAKADDATSVGDAGMKTESTPGVTQEMPNGEHEVRNTPLIFDPQSKKYFISGKSKFTLRQAEAGVMVEKIELSLDGSDYAPYSGGVQLVGEGKHTLKFRASSSVNQWSPVQFTEVFVDLTPPSSDFQVVPDDKFYKDSTGLYASPLSSLVLTAQDNLSGVGSIEYSWDGNTYTPYTAPITLEQKGKQTLFYRAIDKVGNVEPRKMLAFMVDGTPPVSSLKIQGLAKPTFINGKNYMAVNDSVAFSVQANDEASKVKRVWVSIDEKPYTPYLNPVFFLKEGPHTMAYFAEDNVGNKEQAKRVEVYSVSQPPRTIATMVGKTVNTGGINFGTGEFQLKLEARDNAVGLDRIEVKMDSDPSFHSYLDPIRFKTQGMHTVTYRAVDRAGNMEPARIFSIQIQESAPETTIETAQPIITRNSTTYSPAPNIVTLNVTNTSVGVSKTLYSINDGQFQQYTGPITLNGNEKVYKISYKSIDKLGNEERPKTVSYHMVSAVPVVDLFVTNGQSGEEQVRTTYFEGAPPAKEGTTAQPKGSRGLASMPEDGMAPKAKKKKHK